MSQGTIKERAAGCLLGGAIGDAFGYVVEFDTLEEILGRFGEDGLTRLVLPGGGRALISDDTQMTLFTAEALLNAFEGGVKPKREELRAGFFISYRDWLTTQGDEVPHGSSMSLLLGRKEMFIRRSPGSTCLGALSSGKCGTIESPINDSKGCGGIMRVSPIGLVRSFSPAEALDAAADAAAVTHGHPSGYWSAGALAMIIRLLVDDEGLEEAARSAAVHLQGKPGSGETLSALEKALRLAQGGPCITGRSVESLGGGWVGEEALAIGLYAALAGRGFPDALRISATHGGDSDSTAAITGQILGARLGTAAIPPQWTRQVELADLILDFAERIAAL
jgi:ADP-ribosyl-[dinitrogen reductase] hydrolase